MGSFNTTCFVSQQTISTGDEVYIFPIHQQTSYEKIELEARNYNGEKTSLSTYSFSSSSCYPTGFWTFAGPMITGVYDDYGRFSLHNNEDNITNIISFLDNLTSDALVTLKGKNEYHDHHFDITSQYDPKKKYKYKELEKIWEYVWKSMQQHRIFVKDYNGAVVPLACAVMHKITGDYLIEKISNLQDYNKQSYDQFSYFKSYLNQNLERYVKVFQNKPLSDSMFFITNRIASLENFRFGEFEGGSIRQFYNKDEDKIGKILQSYLQDNPSAVEIDDKCTKLILNEMKDLINVLYIITGLNHINAKFSPMVYASQDYDNSIGAEVKEMVDEVNKKLKEEYIKKNGDDFEEEDEIEAETVKPKTKKAKK